MEEGFDRRLVVHIKESAGLAGAWALRSFLEKNGHARAQREVIKSIELVNEKLHFIGPDDCQEYETGHDLNSGLYATMWGFISEDLQSKTIESSAAALRWRSSPDGLSVLFAAEDLQLLASRIMKGEANVRGIGPKRARHLWEVSAVFMAEPEA